MKTSVLAILLLLAPPLAQRCNAQPAAASDDALPGVQTLSAEEGPDGIVTLRGRIEKFQFVRGPAPERTGDREFRGGVLVEDGRIVLVPRTGQYVGEYDPRTGILRQTARHGQDGGFGMGSAVDGHTVIMTPRGSRNVGIYDARTQTYRDGAPHRQESDNAFLGSALVSPELIVFGPLNAPVVGLYDPVTDTYRDGPEHGEGGHYNFSVITLSTRTGAVIFTPFDSRHVGIYDPVADVYRSGAAHGAGVGSAYSGSAELEDGRIVMAPRNAAHIGIYDPRTDTFTRGPEHGEGPGAFMAAAVMPGGDVVMAPYFSDHVGIYDPELHEYRSGPSVAHVERNQEGRFSGANLTREGDRLIMTNRGAAVIGIVREHPFFGSGAPAEVHFRYRPVGSLQWRETDRVPVGGAGVHRQRIAPEAGGAYEYQFVFSSTGSTTHGEARTLSP